MALGRNIIINWLIKSKAIKDDERELYDYDGNRANFGSSHSQSTYTSDYVSGVYKYACANFSVYSNDGGSNTIYDNTMR